MPRLKNFILVASFAFLGGFAAQLLMGTAAVHAQDVWQKARAFQISDDKNSRGIMSYINDGQPGQFFYDEKGQVRLQMGTYPAAGERGMPLLGLSDKDGHLRLLFRIFGENEVPVIIMKDNQGRDRIVMGLDLSSPDQTPFLKVTGKDGATRDILAQ
ncbi:MAG: hypothetical protein EPN97_06790 [Alphaproteobacteria bacterium]|nr:MAG: hypothetical protein EPN97_06790 [Alphaproteobacteria bacterium]